VQRPKVSQMVIDEFARIIDSQDIKGFEKYGRSIDDADDNQYNWEIMALEETADLQKYLVRMIIQLKNQMIKAYEREVSYINDIEELEGMVLQANIRIKELEKIQLGLEES
jgi:hypothetical protein